MRDDGETGPICRTCEQVVMTTRDGPVCGCTGLSRPRPSTVARRAAAAVGELRRRGVSGAYRLEEV